MRYTYISSGSNTTVKTGPGQVYGVVAGGLAINGGTAFLVDSVSIGVTPNYVTQMSNSSNLAAISLGATGGSFPTFGIPFSTGLTVAATSNANVTVAYD